MSSFREISGKSAESRADLYRSHIDMLIKKKDTDALYQLVDHLIIKEGADQFGRTYITPDVLVYLVSSLEDKEQVNKDPIAVEDLTPLLEKIVSAIRSKADDFPDALMEASWLLSQCYQANDDAKAAAGVLSSFKMDAKCSASNERRVDWYVTTAEFYLDTDDGAGAAMMQIKRAHGLVNEVKDRELLFRFKLTYARVLDADKKFLEASLRYMEISQTAMGIFDESKILTALECAITCAIIAKAGSSRSRVLAMLYSDERSMHLPNFGMLEKMFKERIIRKSELEQFVKSLQDHQNALGPGGRTIPEIAVTEHNILAIAKLYQNISFDELGALLSLPAKTAESLAAKMVEQGRLKAVVDQIEGLVEFSHGSDSGASAVAGSGGVLGEWNSSIGELCLLLNKVTDQIATKHPQYKL